MIRTPNESARWQRAAAGASQAFILLCLLVSVAAACGGTSPAASAPTPTPSPTPGPTDVVTKFYSAIKTADCQVAFSLLVDPVLSRIKSADRVCLAYSGQNQLRDFKLGVANNTSSTVATVPVTQTTDKGTSQVVVTVVKVSGEWKISDLASA